MNKNYVLILLFSKDKEKILLVKRKKNPYMNCWNGIGGKIEKDESIKDAAIRECLEETNVTITSPTLLYTIIYPDNNNYNKSTTLNILYDFVDMKEISENEEGIYEWKPLDFALDFNNKSLAGLANVSQFVKEICDLENIKKFY